MVGSYWNLLTWDGSYLYYGLRTGNSADQVIQIDTATMTTVNKWVGNSGENIIFGVLAAGGFIYAVLRLNPGQVIKISPATMAKVSKWTGASGEANSNCLAWDGAHL
jgi:hypothetical protein